MHILCEYKSRKPFPLSMDVQYVSINWIESPEFQKGSPTTIMRAEPNARCVQVIARFVSSMSFNQRLRVDVERQCRLSQSIGFRQVEAKSPVTVVHCIQLEFEIQADVHLEF